MHTINRFTGQKIGDFNYIFFYITAEFIQTNKKITEALDPLLEIFASNLDKFGAVKKPFRAKIPETYEDIIKKGWSHDELLQKLPALLIINVDYDDFDRNKNMHLFISLRDSINNTGDVDIYEIQRLLNELTYGTTVDELFSVMNSYFVNKNKDNRGFGKALIDAISALTMFSGFEFDPKKFLSMPDIIKRLKDNKMS